MTDVLLLDTCALLWLASGDRGLSAKARSLIENAPVVYVSPVTAWEIAVKASRGKIQLPISPREWFDSVVKMYGIDVLKLSADDMLLSAELPWLHKDPADRFIIATALKNGFMVVTADGNFGKYGVKTIC
ncbi:MAG: type II toxin-antitoxin system VapC family toxin [Kiritimatiellae bacterium]|nr:type II toxin-antitoxin system VapC family toxin [Kiritimatiellia bacterium]